MSGIGKKHSTAMARYQLRRVAVDPRAATSDPLVVPNMISRDHSEIRRQRNEDGTTSYYLLDRSLNGTYVNEYRAKEMVLLHPGDTIKFGHVNGAAISPGAHAPQPYSEFMFVFEKVPRNSSAAATAAVITESTTATTSSIMHHHQQQQQQQQPPPSQQQSGYLQPSNATSWAAAANFAPYTAAAHQLPRGFAYTPTFSPYHQANFLAAAAASQHPAAYAAAFYQQQGWQQQQQTRPQQQIDQAMMMQQQAFKQQQWPPIAGSCAMTTPIVSSPNTRQPTSIAATRILIDQMTPHASLPNQMTSHASLPNQMTPHASLPTMRNYPIASTSANNPPVVTTDVKKMECDSSVPSPPKSIINTTTTITIDDDKDDNDTGLSHDLRALAASAAENSRLIDNESPDDVLFANTRTATVNKSSVSPSVSSTKQSSKSRSPSIHSPPSQPMIIKSTNPHQPTQPKKAPRKTNEVARLLNDLTEGSWMHVAGRSLTGESHHPRGSPRKTTITTAVIAKVDNDSDKSEDKMSNSDGDDSDASSVIAAAAAIDSPSSSSSASDATSSSESTIVQKSKKSLSTSRRKTTPRSASMRKKSTSLVSTKSRQRSTTTSRKRGIAPHSSNSNTNRKRRRKPKSESDNESSSSSSSDEAIDDDMLTYKRANTSKVILPKSDESFVDEWQYHDPTKLCDAGTKCQMPQNLNINWIQCDRCEKWYHAECVNCDYADIVAREADFDCGCAQVSTKKKSSNRKR